MRLFRNSPTSTFVSLPIFAIGCDASVAPAGISDGARKAEASAVGLGVTGKTTWASPPSSDEASRFLAVIAAHDRGRASRTPLDAPGPDR